MNIHALRDIAITTACIVFIAYLVRVGRNDNKLSRCHKAESDQRIAHENEQREQRMQHDHDLHVEQMDFYVSMNRPYVPEPAHTPPIVPDVADWLMYWLPAIDPDADTHPINAAALTRA